MEREVGGGIGMGNTCKPLAVSFQCMTKSTTNKKKKKKRKKNKKKNLIVKSSRFCALRRGRFLFSTIIPSSLTFMSLVKCTDSS